MIKIQEQDLDALKFDGIIVSVPKDIKEGQHDDISFIFECAYYSKGEHGYPEEGHNPNNSSFYSAWYNDNYLPKGLCFNSTSRFTLEHIFRFDSYDYYKFNSMVEFCVWYITQNDLNRFKSYNTSIEVHSTLPQKKLKTRKAKSCYNCPAETIFDYETGAKCCRLNYDREEQVLIVNGVIVYKYSPKECCHKPKTQKEFFKRWKGEY